MSAGALLTACAAVPGVAFEQLCDDPLVISCDRAAESTLVVIDADSPNGAVSEFASALDHATSAFDGTVSLEARSSHDVVLDPEVAPPFTWRIEVNAVDPALVDEMVSDMLAASAVAGAVGITHEGGWGSVMVQHLDLFEQVFEQLSRGVFEDGATYTLQSLDERLRIVQVPSRTSEDAIREIISIAQDYPDAEVLLEATTSGMQSPTFYVSRLTPPQQQEVAARLRDPRFGTADVDGYPLEFVLGALGQQGVTYVSGTFGDVPVD